MDYRYLIRSYFEEMLVRYSWADREFRHRLETEGVEALKASRGGPFPDEIKFRLHLEGPDTLIFLLPFIQSAESFPLDPTYSDDFPGARYYAARKNFEYRLLSRVWSDTQARKSLLEHPQAMFKECFGAECPLQIEVIEEDDRFADVVLPYGPFVAEMELNDELNQASGWQLHHAELHAFKVLGGNLMASPSQV